MPLNDDEASMDDFEEASRDRVAVPRADNGTDAMPREKRGPDTIPMDPKPLNYQVLHVTIGGKRKSVLARNWRLDDAIRCRLCPEGACSATVDSTGEQALCSILVNRHVGHDEAMLFRVGRQARSDLGNTSAGA
jgi:hypothetical protein